LSTAALSAHVLPGVPEVRPGTDLAELITDVAASAGVAIGPGDVLVLSQKIVSKAEGRLVLLDDVQPSARARQMADRLHKDPQMMQVVLDESIEVLRAERGVLITRTRHGLVCANAGVDQSNVPGDDIVCLLPVDPDGSARAVRARLGTGVAVVIADSFGRAWRLGQADIAIGCAGLAPIDDRRGTKDAEGRELAATIDAIADQAASAAALVRDKAGREGVVILRGLERYITEQDGPGAAAIIRPEEEDLFR
jgi:coenzyme F420-0:L-glutamate ligase / coenzyme F420-1:gamma-L-glutamate ligase